MKDLCSSMSDGTLCSTLKFVSKARHLHLVSFLFFELIFTWYTTSFHCFVILKILDSEPTFTIAVAPHLRGFTTHKFQNNETVKCGCIPSKNEFKTQKHTKLRSLASDTNLKVLQTWCPIVHGSS